MNGAKMSKKFFFEIIEKELEDLKKKIEELKADTEISHEGRMFRESILFGELSELINLNYAARDIDYWKYTELDAKIYAVRETI